MHKQSKGLRVPNVSEMKESFKAEPILRAIPAVWRCCYTGAQTLSKNATQAFKTCILSCRCWTAAAYSHILLMLQTARKIVL